MMKKRFSAAIIALTTTLSCIPMSCIGNVNRNLMVAMAEESSIVNIISQPKSQVASIGETATFHIEAINAKSYRWYNSSDGKNWYPLSWQTADSADFTTAT
ncbi:MAG: hypothetical protein K6G20_11895, partial [Ruminococcus sp.]|nr:hypothetical protein [Ruminococcus sp.]